MLEKNVSFDGSDVNLYVTEEISTLQNIIFVSLGLNTAAVVTNQAFIIVRFDYLKYNKKRHPYKIKQKLQNSVKVTVTMSLSISLFL